MGAITAGAASDKITELKSKLAVYATWVDLIQANYMPSDGGAPELRITRDDGGLVSESHLRAVLEDIEQRCAEIREELAEWEGLTFEPASARVRPLHPANDAPPKKPAGVAERSKLGGRRLQPAPK